MEEPGQGSFWRIDPSFKSRLVDQALAPFKERLEGTGQLSPEARDSSKENLNSETNPMSAQENDVMPSDGNPDTHAGGVDISVAEQDVGGNVTGAQFLGSVVDSDDYDDDDDNDDEGGLVIDTSQSSQLDEISNQISGLLESIEEEEGEAGFPQGESSYFQTDDHNYNRRNQSPPEATTRTDSVQGVPLVADMVIDPMDTSSSSEED